jgi:hypothetical protein
VNEHAQAERQKAQEAFDAARLEVDGAQRELDVLKARLIIPHLQIGDPKVGGRSTSTGISCV